MLLEAMLQKLKLNSHHVSNGKEAINYIKNNPRVRLILMDIKLPGLDGYATTMELKKIDPNVKVFLTTGWAYGSMILSSFHFIMADQLDCFSDLP